MVVVPNILKRLAKRFGVQPISQLHPQIQQFLHQGSDQFIKAPAGFEPLITGGGYEWDDSINGYRLGQGQRIYLLPNGIALWVFKDAVARAIPPDSIAKWVSADDEYPMGKANAFFKIYGYLTGQDLGEGDTAGDNVQDGETPPGDEGGVATADDEEGGFFSKQDIQNMLKGDYSAAGGGPKASMQTSVPGGEPGTGKMPEPDDTSHLTGPPPSRASKGAPLEQPHSEADLIIKTLYKKAKINPASKLSKQNPIRLDSDEILDLYQRAKTLPPEDREKLIAFLKSGAVKPLEEGHIAKATLAALMEHIVGGIMQEVDKAKKKSRVKKAKKPVSKSASRPNPDDPYDPVYSDPDAGNSGQYGKEPEKPEHSQMDWEPGQERGFGDNRGQIEKWIEAVAYKLWKDPMDIGRGGVRWRIAKQNVTDNGTKVYLLQRSKQATSTRIFANMNGKWFYFNPEADIQDRKWKPVEANPPGEDVTIEMSGAGAAGPTSGPMRVKDGPLEEMTTTSGGGGSSAGTPGYSIPGAFSGGSLADKKKHIEVLGYKLTGLGKQELERSPDKLYEALKNELKGFHIVKEASGLGPDFDRAQRAYDRQMPPESDDLQCPQCGEENGYYTERGHRAGAHWYSAECPDCGYTWGDDNFDALDDR
jgi:DNA-directed RNA polymerase subunit M/transcription elongation factor TFIIS